MVEKHRWTGVGSQHSSGLISISSENVLHPHPTWPQPAARRQNGRTSKGGRGRSYSVQSPSCSERAREPLLLSALYSASAPTPRLHLAETRRYAFPLGPLRLPGVTGPRRLRSGHGLPVAPPPCRGCSGQFRGTAAAAPKARFLVAILLPMAVALRKIELFVLPWRGMYTHARQRSFGLSLYSVSLAVWPCDPGSSSFGQPGSI